MKLYILFEDIQWDEENGYKGSAEEREDRFVDERRQENLILRVRNQYNRDSEFRPLVGSLLALVYVQAASGLEWGPLKQYLENSHPFLCADGKTPEEVIALVRLAFPGLEVEEVQGDKL